MDSPSKTQQDRVQEIEERARQAAAAAKAGGEAAQKVVMATWRGAKTTGEKLILIGGALGTVCFFLPWVSVSFFVVSTAGSGFTLARTGFTILWLFPVMMGLCLYLAWRNLGCEGRKRLLLARWYIAMGAGWSWTFLTFFTAFSSSMQAGSLLSMAASVMVLLGGVLQIRDRANLISGPQDELPNVSGS